MVNILTGIPFNTPKRLNHREDEVALEFPSSASSRRRNLLALKAQNWQSIKGEPPMPSGDFNQFSYLAHTGATAGLCPAVSFPIPVTPGKAVTVSFGPAIGITGIVCAVEYDADGKRLDSWGNLAGYSERPFKAKSNTAYIVLSCTDLRDLSKWWVKSDGKYVFKDGQLIA